MKKTITILICLILLNLTQCSKLDKKLFGKWINTRYGLGSTILTTFNFFSDGKFLYNESMILKEMPNSPINKMASGTWSISNDVINFEVKSVEGLNMTLDTFKPKWKFESVSNNKAYIYGVQTHHLEIIPKELFERIKIFD